MPQSSGDMCAEPDTVKHVSDFRTFLSQRSGNETMMRLALYASYRHATTSSKRLTQKQRTNACQRCGNVLTFNTRVCRVRRSGCKRKNRKKIRLQRVCGLCGSVQTTDEGDEDTATGDPGPDQGQTPAASAAISTPKPTPTTPATPTATNLQKLLTAKKRRSLNEKTGLLDFLITSNT